VDAKEVQPKSDPSQTFYRDNVARWLGVKLTLELMRCVFVDLHSVTPIACDATELLEIIDKLKK
jgi:hypothetical protein